jgi:polyphosphate kinase 2 (PPK2 family)
MRAHAATDEEKTRHYLWRFWRHLPRLGRVTFYDRSWYGRVLVERVEGFADEGEWMRAYAEINDFERQLTEYGIVLFKGWLQHPAYLVAASEMIGRTSTTYAPWHLIANEDKRWGRVEVFATLCRLLEQHPHMR